MKMGTGGDTAANSTEGPSEKKKLGARSQEPELMQTSGMGS